MKLQVQEVSVTIGATPILHDVSRPASSSG
jgi:hypothetical protein